MRTVAITWRQRGRIVGAALAVVELAVVGLAALAVNATACGER